MRKLLSLLKSFFRWVRNDGLLHICVTAILFMLFAWIRPLWIPNLIVLSIGIFKEVYDLVTDRGTAEVHDVICDLMGLVLGNLIFVLNLYL